MLTSNSRVTMIDNPQASAQEWSALAQMLACGVTLGEPVHLTPQQARGAHMCCDFHLIDTRTGEEVDGGAASTLAGYLAEGMYPSTAHLQVVRIL